jgi:hypothetical protein
MHKLLAEAATRFFSGEDTTKERFFTQLWIAIELRNSLTLFDQPLKEAPGCD